MPDEARGSFTPDPLSVSAARRFARETADAWGVNLDDVALIVGELAANAVVHGGTLFVVSIGRRDHTVSIEVSDEGGQAVHACVVSPEELSGRGLLIVDRIATAWGTRPTAGGGKVVWAELDE